MEVPSDAQEVRIRETVVAVVSHGDSFLLVRHNHPDSSPDEWRPIQGGIEVGEIAVDAGIREADEEADIEIPEFLPEIVSGRIEPKLGRVKDGMRKRYTPILIFLQVRNEPPVHPQAEEHIADAQFFPREEALQRIEGIQNPQTRVIMRSFLSQAIQIAEEIHRPATI
jgi:8-oxo-dGTP pyrophosphatase MutT (NUDIX family)